MFTTNSVAVPLQYVVQIVSDVCGVCC